VIEGIKMPTADQFRKALNGLLDDRRRNKQAAVDVTAGDLHRRVGGYPGPKHSMPVCCSVMRSIVPQAEQQLLSGPPSGKGASLTIRYLLKAGSPDVAQCGHIHSTRPESTPQKLLKPAMQPSMRTENSSRIRLLVVGSCSNSKNLRDCPCLLTAAGLKQNSWRDRLKQWELPAVQLYTGPQHLGMMNGVQVLRQHSGARACEVKIISAGYGLVTENQPLVPYEVTFSGLRPREILKRALELEIPTRLQSATAEFPLVVFLLGKDYLYSAQPLLRPKSGQRFLFFTSPDMAHIVEAARTTVVHAGKPEAQKYGASTLSLKGRMFQLLAQGLAHHPGKWVELLNDDTPGTATFLMESAL